MTQMFGGCLALFDSANQTSAFHQKNRFGRQRFLGLWTLNQNSAAVGEIGSSAGRICRVQRETLRRGRARTTQNKHAPIAVGWGRRRFPPKKLTSDPSFQKLPDPPKQQVPLAQAENSKWTLACDRGNFFSPKNAELEKCPNILQNVKVPPPIQNNRKLKNNKKLSKTRYFHVRTGFLSEPKGSGEKQPKPF